MKKLLNNLVFISLIGFFSNCSNSNNQPMLMIETENSSIAIEKFQVCEDFKSFYVNFDDSYTEEIGKENVKKIYFKKGEQKIEVYLFKILYSPNEDYNYQTPITPKGKLALFESEIGQVSINVISKSNKEIAEFLKPEKITKCASR
ncbi:hypothetical protein [Flavobacterium nitrogenifigens]|uniref:hypothetical protein n=1 Tax=Flavobacterium nitrogenifigens TaxID=1617283 RepID=UPI0031B18799